MPDVGNFPVMPVMMFCNTDNSGKPLSRKIKSTRNKCKNELLDE